ncbi:hypothetical protein E2C01_019639 [Portunus trituberculatus]|uniref:Uncharacterized protein n=1 Tax=Portunus trituberculatus TaxID=210409 RepID=A0A5B7DYH4_PORTR|nr:hypothetical protein [Portunus trituberculatus]
MDVTETKEDSLNASTFRSNLMTTHVHLGNINIFYKMTTGSANIMDDSQGRSSILVSSQDVGKLMQVTVRLFGLLVICSLEASLTVPAPCTDQGFELLFNAHLNSLYWSVCVVRTRLIKASGKF